MGEDRKTSQNEPNHPNPKISQKMQNLPQQIETSAQIRSKEQSSKNIVASFFSNKQQKVTQTNLERLELNWKKFRSDLDKILIDPEKYENNSKKCIEEKLKPRLQQVLDAILQEDLENRENKTIGDCLEYTLKTGIIQELVAYGKNDRPQGLFVICLKFISYIILDIQATHIINHQEVHPAIMQLMMHIHNSIKNNMLDLQYDNGDLKKYIIELIKSLTTKIYEQPSLVNLLFTDSRIGTKKGAYLPMSILLLLLIKEDISESEDLKLILRDSILMHLKLNNQEVLRYIVEESEICVILVAKLGYYFQALPQEVDLISNNKVVSQYPEDEESKFLAQLNLNEQITQIFSNDKKDQHAEFREFVKFCAFLNKCALCILHSGKLIENLCTEIFNQLLLETLQPRLLKADKPKIIRTSLQYVIQILTMFTCSKLIKIVYHFLFGFPASMNIALQEEPNNRQSLLSISKFDSLLEKSDHESLKESYKHSRQSSIAYNSNSSGKQSQPFNYAPSLTARPQRNFANDIQLKISRANFEHKNMKSSYAINNPFMPPLQSPLHQKAARMNEIIDSVMESSFYDDALDNYNSNQNSAIYIGPVYNHDNHKSKQLLQMLFKNLHKKEEKIGFTVLKFLDLILEKNIIEINDALFLQSIQKYVSTSIQGHNNQQSIQVSSISKLQDKFIQMFPTASSFIYNSHKTNNYQELNNILVSQLQKVSEAISMQLNEQNLMLTDDGMEMMDIFSFLLMSDHSMTLAEFDNQILQSPKRGVDGPQIYKIQEETNDFTLPTEDDEDFQLEDITGMNKFPGRKLNFDDSYSSPTPSLKSKSMSANYELDDIERIDPSTFSQKGDFIRQISAKLQQFLANTPEENLLLTSIISRIFSFPAKLDEEYNMVDQMHSKSTLLHLFLFEIPSQFSSQHYSNPCQFLSILRIINEKIEELLQDRMLVLLVNAVKKEPDFLAYSLSEKVNSLVIGNTQLSELFMKKRREIYSIVVFEEFLKEIAGCLYVKELAVDMLESYEQAHLEDIKFECALAKFKKEIVKEDEIIEKIQ
ncbi:UNKNOWN [Stylonychia lemnae]|uniref:Uncharacterized protein n=1 Tax=Stylonychia lemnae TaxID=5949 RepID=A0A078ADT3_STYLE|nr:UNKNOWN [Stylonychia lemnae]|eukprot:CDW80011.1 UNKNOWN [Stylonychia lemnae]